MLRQIEWGVQDGPITKYGVLPLTTFENSIYVPTIQMTIFRGVLKLLF